MLASHQWCSSLNKTIMQCKLSSDEFENKVFLLWECWEMIFSGLQRVYYNYSGTNIIRNHF